MTRVRTRRDLSRLLLPFSSFETLHLPRNLILLLLGLVSVRSVLACGESAGPQSHDFPAFPRPDDVAERNHRQRGPADYREWPQRGLSQNRVPGSSDRPGSLRVHDGDRPSQRGTKEREEPVARRRENSNEPRVDSLEGSPFDASSRRDTRKRHERRKFRREEDGRTDGAISSTVASASSFAKKHTGHRAKRNFGRDAESEAAANSLGLNGSLSDCAGCAAEFFGDPGSVGRNRSDTVTDNPKPAGNNETGGAVNSTEIDGDPSPPSDGSEEEPFTGFEGSQKFPIKVTYKPPVVPQVEKFDRRHFGPPKVDPVPETTAFAFPSTLSPDLPKSPGRDVLNRHRKVDEITEEERRQETVEASENMNDTDDFWLPGASSGRRSSNIAGGKPSPEEKRVTTVTEHPTSTSTTAATTVREDSQSEKINITILGLFEMTRGLEPRPEGPSELQAAILAVEHVNKMNILSKFRLRLIYNDTKCDPGVAVDRFFHALYSAKKNDLIPLLLGTACSEVTETLAKIVPYWNVTQVSFGSTAPALSDTTEFPLFLRTVAPDSSHNSARIALIKHFGWDTVTTLSQTGDMYSLAVNDLVTELEQANITCTATITFAENDYKEQLRTLKELDTRIIIGSFSPRLAPRVFCETSSSFTSELARIGVTHSKYAAQTYDAVWTMALGLERTEIVLNKENSSLAQYTHKRKDIAKKLLEQMKLLRFVGVSGPVSFDGADRVGITAFYQMHDHMTRRIATFNPEDEKLIMNCPECATTKWPGGQPPTARRVFRLRVVTVAPAAFLAVTCIASVGVTLALAFLAFNLHFRRHKSIKLSSPRLNNMAAVGCGLVYAAVILLGLDHATLPDSDDYYPAVCTARVYLLSAGFSLAFGSMFTKTYRVHRIFTKSRSGVVKNKLLQDTRLISLICVLLLIDGLVVTLWVTFDPMQRHLRNLTLEFNPQDRGVVYQPQVEVCHSQHTNSWLGALYVYKGLLLIVGVYMAWETRHVKIPALNDSQYIGMSVYFVVITSGIVVVLANLMSDRATLAFVTITALILASTTATLALLFLPQLANILAGERADPVVQSLGLKIECNTRRFVTDDKNELQYRVEVQNRVYRREMAQLELELARLEKQLAQEPVEPSHASSSASIPQRNPSIGGGLPLLLLSVLPPVIPRASWPSADPSGMRRGTVAFSSQPDLEPDGPRRSLADIYKLHRRRETEGPNRLGVFQRLFSLFGSRPASRKTSTASFTGVASALRVHMGYIAGLVPGTKAASTCQVNAQGARPPHPRCGSGPIISITSEEDRRLSLGLRRKECSEPRVNFSLPPKASTSQTSSREKIRGSPRFPHRIVPANSLNAIASGSSISKSQRWHSMEDARRTKAPQGLRGLTCSPSYDVWATREVGIPLSELGNTARGKKPPESLGLPSTAESKAGPDDTRLGNDSSTLFRGNDSPGTASPAELEMKSTRQASPASSSPANVRTSDDTNGATPSKIESRPKPVTGTVQLDASTNFTREPEHSRVPSRPSSPIVHVANLDEPEAADNRANPSCKD
ncbi:gamma-aminobutyric acid type B receptor subunit 3 isoform X3 [Nomia melanderi]|uniref:gamma-aminobutyric acid type B receptor subunit 3 isoform X3 n=1 Tax=Nomia melanderi TaxID=2448451 RepID=UPI003FCCA791